MPPAKKRPAPAAARGAVIEIRGARQNNLKNLDLDIPVGKLSVVTGPSGSGKSSLAFDTLYAEGQRRYVETFSPYTRQFLDRMDKPLVDEIRGIPPAIAIEQSNYVKTTRSTVGTITEINDYLKLLMPRVAHAFCPTCQREIRTETASTIVRHILEEAPGKTLLVTFGVSVPEKTKPADFFQFLGSQGYLRVWIYGKMLRTDEAAPMKALPAVVRVIQDRIEIAASNVARLNEAVEAALNFGKDRLSFLDAASGEEHPYSTGWHCAHCDLDIRPPSPALFSFNNPQGACPDCRGFGRVIGIDTHRALPNQRLSLRGGVVKPFQTSHFAECQEDLLRCARAARIDVNKPFRELPAEHQRFVIEGDPAYKSAAEASENNAWYGVRGFFDWLESRTYKMHVRVLLSRYRSYTTCPRCHGGRFQPDALNYCIPDQAGGWLTLPQASAKAIRDLETIFAKLKLPKDDDAAEMLANEIRTRIRYLNDVGLGYLTLDRSTRTLSGGEIERVNLTTCLGASLVNTLFVMDEPSVGLHPRDVSRLLRVMHDLRDKGNTLVVVEHEESVMRAADNMIEIGPGRGESGGELVHNGPLNELLGKDKSLTGQYLSGKKSIPVPSPRRKPKGWLKIKEAAANNLKKIDVQIPLGIFTCVTGVSGSGKSTLVHEVLHRNLVDALGGVLEEEPGLCGGIDGAEQIGRVIMVDQSPLARSPRSTPIVYLGAFDSVRDIFAMTPEARAQGLNASAFSFNSGQGRCERCAGLGFEKIEMQFLSDLYVRCAECEGRRYQPHVLKVRHRNFSIDEVLGMTVTEALGFFAEEERAAAGVMPALRLLDEVGLGYLRLGQPLNTLSGGESQRLKLVGHLVENKGKDEAARTLFIFDEPTTGLHFDDVAMLLKAFQSLVERGDSLLVIEHNLEVIKSADYLIDLGPEAGDEGGLVVATGTPEEAAKHPTSHTGRFLRSVLGPKSSRRTRYEAQDWDASSRVAEAPRRDFSAIGVYGAREHNLKNITLRIPREKMVVITGLSGSGKSTLAFDLLFAEGQRRFLDSMSPYARQFVEQMEKPDVDLIEGLPPTVAIEQRLSQGGGKSTVATVTEIYHFLRLLFAKLGVQHCPKCNIPVEKQSLSSIVRQAEEAAQRGKVRLLAPLVKARKGFHTEVAKWAEKQGFETLLVDGALVPVKGFEKLERFKEHTIDVVVGEMQAKTIAKARNLVQRAIEIGRGTAKLLDHKNKITMLSTEMACPECGEAFEELDPRLFSFNSPHGWCPTCRGFGEVFAELGLDGGDDDKSELERELQEERHRDWVEDDQADICPECAGSRLNRVARSVRFQKQTIDGVADMAVADARRFLDKLKFTPRQEQIARDLVAEMRQRFLFLEKVGLGYLTLNRAARTLSGGESQRIRLAAQLGSNLRGVLYVLDEPTIGLHPRDNRQLIETLLALREKGNSLVVVEHDEDTMRNADFIVDLGPGAGSHGGQVVASGTLPEIERNPRSATGRYLKSPMRHPLRGERRKINGGTPMLTLRGASANNLKQVTASFPIGRLTVISGISGSGKSSLLRSVLLPAVQQSLAGGKPKLKEKTWKEISGAEALEAVYEVDQSPIGKTSRSTPATYIKVFDEIRELFAQLPVSRMRGYSASRFSFNVAGGRCETCGGHGAVKLEMSFLPTSYVPCEECGGKRYNAQTIEALYQDRSIADVMEMTIAEAAEFFSAHPKIARPLRLLLETGLGYLKLGQPSPTLSGGEAQRIKLVTELTRGVARGENARLRRQQTPKSTLYLLEEPTIGLHMADVEQLIQVFHRLVDGGATVVVIEHNLDVIAEADYIIDIGPEAGEAGGEVVTAGTPETVAKHKTSRIAPFLKEML